MHIRLLLILFVLNLVSAESFSGKNPASITGRVTDQNEEPVSYATLMLLDKDSVLVKADYTRDDGTFTFQQVPAGEYQIKLRSIQYEPFLSEFFTVKEGQTLTLDPIKIAESVQQLGEVEVTAAKPLVEIHPDKTVFNIAASANASGTDALEMLRKAPGVMIDNNDNVILQGKSGVKIYIDGKPSHLKGEDLINMLRNMQSDAVESVEIITNPPAKYDAEGNAGIINIKLKRDKNLGTNVSVNAGYNIGERESYHGGANFNYRNKKLNVFGHYNYHDNKGFSSENHHKLMNNTFLDQESKILWDWKGHDFRLGTDYQLGSKHLVGFIVNGNVNDGRINVTSYTPFGNRETGQVDQILDANSVRDMNTDNINANLNYVFTGSDESKLNVDADYGYFYKTSRSDQANIYLDSEGVSEIAGNFAKDNQLTRIDIRTVKFDYERPFGPGVFSFGAKWSDVETDNGFLFYNIIDGEEITDDNRSNDFDFREKIAAGYINYQSKLSDRLSVNAGVRVEHTASRGVLESFQDNKDNEVERSYADIFPSGGLSYKLNDKNMMALNYSRRVNRPGYEQLNPFEFQLDELTYRKGNPFLNPQYAHNMQLSYSFNHNLNVQLSYSLTDDYFAQILDTVGQRGWMISVQNMEQERNMGMNISYSLDITDKWNVYLSGNLYNVSYTSGISGKDINLDQTVYHMYGKSSYRLPAGFDVEVSGWYNSPSIWGGTFRMQELWSMDVGVKKSLWNNTATVKASVSDIFLTNQWNGTSSYDGLEMTSGGRYDSRQLRVSLTYNLGNQQVKSSRKRATGLEDEKNRLNKE